MFVEIKIIWKWYETNLKYKRKVGKSKIKSVITI